MAEQVLVILVCMLTLALIALLVWWAGRPVSSLDRQAAIRAEALAAEARIDFLTRRVMQQMRDTVRSELREPRDGQG